MGSTESPEVRFGRFVKRERERMGLSQAELAEQLTSAGLKAHPTTIAKIEARDSDKPRAIRLDEAAALAAIFDRTLDEMLNSPTEVSRDAAVERVIRQVHFLTKSLRKDADELTRDLEHLAAEELLNEKSAGGTLNHPYEGWSEVELRALLLAVLSSELLGAIGDVYHSAIDMVQVDLDAREVLVQKLFDIERSHETPTA